jgi:predicted permease
MNPLLIGCAVAAIMLLIKFRLPEPFGGMAHMCGQASIPLMLLCVGAGLNFSALAAAPAYMIAGVGLRLIWGPIAMLISAELMGIHGLSKLVLVAAGSTPTAASGYVLARQMGGDDKLMAGLVTATTLLSALTIPLAQSLAAH